mmetsp:Transcript_29543/g.94532  ORF Transcript_29543/g.94532 Transcript_29543/m.94532 type:complete len:231 (+) Transcript_29543:773-1465(+)
MRGSRSVRRSDQRPTSSRAVAIPTCTSYTRSEPGGRNGRACCHAKPPRLRGTSAQTSYEDGSCCTSRAQAGIDSTQPPPPSQPPPSPPLASPRSATLNLAPTRSGASSVVSSSLTKASHTPPPTSSHGCAVTSHPLKSPTSDAAAAEGAHSRKRQPTVSRCRPKCRSPRSTQKCRSPSAEPSEGRHWPSPPPTPPSAQSESSASRKRRCRRRISGPEESASSGSATIQSG